MTANGTIPERTPLSVMLFHAAMDEHKSISDYADQLDIGAISLRQFIEGNTQRPRQKTLDLIGKALNMTVDEVRRRMGLVPEAAPSFGEWLDGAMRRAGYSRARLTRETNISDGALRNYLANNTMPDSHQAQRIAEVLNSDTLEVARIIVAQTVAKNGGTLAPAAPDEPEADDAPEADGVEMAPVEEALAVGQASPGSPDEATLLTLWRQLHPQGRRATYSYIAMLLAER
jgi:transcriptional regulator with XRE-family HTH domain